MKPLGRKSYGSIPHLPGSRTGPKDKHCHEGQARICTERPRDRHDRIIVTEKLDGSNCGICKVNGVIYPLTRAGYLADTSPYEQHWHFANWVYENQQRFLDALEEGERICGEWLMQAHGTRYVLHHEPFVAFDLMVGANRIPFDELTERMTRANLMMPAILHDAQGTTGAISIEAVMRKLEPAGFHGAIDPVEGAVWRVERRGKVDFLAKYVRSDKVDGRYLPELNGGKAVWNWRPKKG